MYRVDHRLANTHIFLLKLKNGIHGLETVSISSKFDKHMRNDVMHLTGMISILLAYIYLPIFKVKLEKYGYFYKS